METSKVGIYYLNWDKYDRGSSDGLTKGLILGATFPFIAKNYRCISEYNTKMDLSNQEALDEYLENTYRAFNLGQQGMFERSMSVGDLISINNKRYVVKVTGFELVAKPS